MSDGSISIKLAPDYEMKAVQKAVESYGEDEDLILNDSFFPKISISEFRNVARIDGTITTARLKDALMEAIASVNDELANYKSKQTVATLSAVENAKIGGQNILAYRYKRAVHCLAQANLYERYASYDTTNDGEKKMELLQESIGQLRRDARFAISDILKCNRINVELI